LRATTVMPCTAAVAAISALRSARAALRNGDVDRMSAPLELRQQD
jgi:hypothetical protein